MQVVGDDLHLTVFVGAQQMMDEAPEHGLDVTWLDSAEKPQRSHSVGERSPFASMVEVDCSGIAACMLVRRPVF